METSGPGDDEYGGAGEGRGELTSAERLRFEVGAADQIDDSQLPQSVKNLFPPQVGFSRCSQDTR
jgi:hypothetical protein